MFVAPSTLSLSKLRNGLTGEKYHFGPRFYHRLAWRRSWGAARQPHRIDFPSNPILQIPSSNPTISSPPPFPDPRSARLLRLLDIVLQPRQMERKASERATREISHQRGNRELQRSTGRRAARGTSSCFQTCASAGAPAARDRCSPSRFPAEPFPLRVCQSRHHLLEESVTT